MHLSSLSLFLLLHSRQTSITGHFPNTGWSLMCSAHTVFYTWHACPTFIQLTLCLIFIGDAGEVNPPYPPKAILFLIVHDLFLSITLPVTLLYFSSCRSCFRVSVHLLTSLLNQKLAEGRDCPGNCHIHGVKDAAKTMPESPCLIPGLPLCFRSL